jgi:hypothetical protein
VVLGYACRRRCGQQSSQLVVGSRAPARMQHPTSASSIRSYRVRSSIPVVSMSGAGYRTERTIHKTYSPALDSVTARTEKCGNHFGQRLSVTDRRSQSRSRARIKGVHNDTK